MARHAGRSIVEQSTALQPEVPVPARQLNRASRLFYRLRRNALAIAAGVGAACCAGLVIWLGIRLYVARDAYHHARVDIRLLDSYADRDAGSLTEDDLAHIQDSLVDLDRQIDRIDQASALPFGASLVEHVPVAGPRYRAGRQMIEVGKLLTGAGITGASVGRATLDAFDATGAKATAGPKEATWLDVVLAREPEIRQALADVAEAKELRAGIDVRYLPTGIRDRMGRLDRALDRVDYGTIADQYFPIAREMLGADRPVRFLLLFQNPAELRPSGGFPGTMGLITIERGQLRDYQIFDAHTLSDHYIAEQHPPRGQPWPIQQYFPSPSLILHDATWWADFPRSGQTILSMYQETDWPPADGVVAVQPTVISAFLRITGPVTVEINGEQREITADNVYDEIERQRRLHREGQAEGEHHKEILELIGTELIERFETADRGMVVEAARALRDAADVRDLQAYMAAPEAESLLDDQGWSGRVIPDPAVETMAIVLSNVVTNKASMRLIPDVKFTFDPVVDGRRRATLQIWLTNTGTNDEDPFYAGFSKWWVEIWLPQGSTRLQMYPDPMPDPESPDGGSYLIEIFPQQVGYLSVTFEMPATEELTLRRQPGVVPLNIAYVAGPCGATGALTLTDDAVLPLGALCPN